MAQITDPEVAILIVKARTSLLLDDPFFGTLVTNLVMKEDLSVQTLCVSRTTIRYNPKFIRTLSPEELKTALAHEIGHPVLDTFGRRGDRDVKGWNIATDYTINEMLAKAGYAHIKGWLHDTSFYGFSSDHIYDLIPKDKKGGYPGTGEDGGSLDDTDPTPSEDEMEMSATDWKMAVVNAANEARRQGRVPAGMERLVEEVLNSQVDWRERLRRFATERSRDDYSWSRPNKRFLPYGIILPSLYSESMGEMVVMIDTSGSIDSITLAAFGAEIKAIQATSRPSKLTVIYCDADVNHVDEFGPNDEIYFNMHGGGGTDFRPPFQYVEDNGLHPVVGVYLTDLYGPEPEQPPPFPFLWCCTTEKVASFGETLKIKV